MITSVPTIIFLGLAAFATSVPQAPPQTHVVEIPKFDCTNVPYPGETGSFASASPAALHDFFVAEKKSGFTDGTTRVLLSFDASGDVVTASISRSSGNRDADQAAMNWAMCTKIKPGKASNAILPVMFRW